MARSDAAPSTEKTIPAPKGRVALALALSQIFSAGTHLVGKGVLGSAGTMTVAVLRFAGAALVLAPLAWLRPGRARIERRDVPRLLWLGVLAVPLNQGFYLFGLTRTTPSHAALLYALTPLVVLLLAGRILREAGLWSKLAGTLVAFLGVVVILLERGLAHEARALSGDLMVLVAVFAWALYTVFSKPMLLKYDPMTVSSYAVVSGSLMGLAVLLLSGRALPLQPVSGAVWGGIAYLVIGTSVIAYPLWMVALRHLEASKVAIATNTQPILTSLLSWLIYRERLTPGFFVGAALILGGAAWVESRKSP
ncbi:MAG: DMT family transporter [Candidatus Eiseniibacteriota bacterium]